MSNETKNPQNESGGFSISEWFTGIKSEFKRVTWPTKTEVVKMTVTVITTSALVGAIIIGYDFILAALYNLVF